MDGPSAGGKIGNLLPAGGAGPGQRRIAAGVTAGELRGCVLGGAEQRSRADGGADSVLLADHDGYVHAGPGRRRLGYETLIARNLGDQL